MITRTFTKKKVIVNNIVYRKKWYNGSILQYNHRKLILEKILKKIDENTFLEYNI